MVTLHDVATCAIRLPVRYGHSDLDRAFVFDSIDARPLIVGRYTAMRTDTRADMPAGRCHGFRLGKLSAEATHRRVAAYRRGHSRAMGVGRRAMPVAPLMHSARDDCNSGVGCL